LRNRTIKENFCLKNQKKMKNFTTESYFGTKSFFIFVEIVKIINHVGI
jgi:hypothetical protein